jgi:hypothetical protein
VPAILSVHRRLLRYEEVRTDPAVTSTEPCTGTVTCVCNIPRALPRPRTRRWPRRTSTTLQTLRCLTQYTHTALRTLILAMHSDLALHASEEVLAQDDSTVG